jgi:hypothetical protein
MTVKTTRKPRPGQDLPESYYKNPNGHNQLTEAFLSIFGLSKHAWGYADNDGEYPDLVLKTAPFFANASNKNRPPLEHLRTALTLMFGENIRYFFEDKKGLQRTRERRFEYEKDDLLWFFEYFKSHYANWAQIAPSAKVYSQWIKDYHEDEWKGQRHDELKKRSPLPTHGYTFPGYNFCGPKNSLDWVPTTMLDAICQYHDLVYANRPYSLEKDDDKEFLTMIKNWAKANAGDGWTGPTYFEKQKFIPLIQGIFAMKGAVGSESPWTKALLPSVLRDFFIDYKQFIQDPHFSESNNLRFVKHSPLVSLNDMVDKTFAQTRLDRKGYRDNIAVNDAINSYEEIKDWWNAQASKHEDVRHLAFKEFKKYEGETRIEKWVPGMFMFQYIKSADTFIMNYHGEDGKIWPIYFVHDARVPDMLWSWSQNPNTMMWSELAQANVPYAIHKSYESRDHKIEGISWEPIYSIWSTLEDPSRQLDNPTPGHRKIYETYKTIEEADAAAKQIIAQQPLEPGRQGEKHSRTDDTEEEYQKKKRKLEVLTETVDPDEVMRGPDEEEVIRPASPDTARRVGEQALAGARDTARSKEAEMSTNNRNQSNAAAGSTAVATTGTLKSTKEMQLVGGVSMDLGPPRSLISLKKCHFTCDVIIRDFHLLDYAFGSSVFEGSWAKRIGAVDSAVDATYNQLDRFLFAKRVAAQCIPLDIPAMCLDNKARFDLDNIPWLKCKFMGGSIQIHAPRHKENQTINGTRLAYTDGGPGLNNVDRKIMWKMYDRERDYNWIYDAHNSATSLGQGVGMDTEALTTVSFLSETDETRRLVRVGQAVSSWNTSSARKNFPQLVKLATDMTSVDGTNSNGDRLYESMQDHALTEGPLTFPMMGWPYYIRNPKRELCFNDLLLGKDADESYSLQQVASSFVGLNYPTMNEQWGKCRQIRASVMDKLDNGKFSLTHNGPFKSDLSINQKADTNTSSHCAMIHVPPLPLYDGSTNFSSIQVDLVVQGTFELDYTAPKDCLSMKAPHCLGEIWDDTIDPVLCPFGGYGMKNFSKSRVQWVTGAGQYLQSGILKAKNVEKLSAIQAVYGVKDQGSMLMSGSSIF